MIKKHIAILGSTGSIGTQSLDVIRNYKDLFEVTALTAYNNAPLLIQQAMEFCPHTVVIGNEEKYDEVASGLSSKNINVYKGYEAICDIVMMPQTDTVIAAMVGFSGLLPTINAIRAGKNIALANKETLVAAGDIITRLASEMNVTICPVDSEHSAIFQCLKGEENNSIEKVYLTASGGPFRDIPAEQLKNVTRDDALKHPNWNMGEKVTIDSSTLMNKGLEAIEAKWLFGLEPHQIEVVIHPQSIIHSLVQFADGSIKAQMGLPDMHLPIQYALTYPNRVKNTLPRFSFEEYSTLSFQKPDKKKFPNLALAFMSLEKGGNMPCAMNAANEIVVNAFLNEKIKFLEMPEIISNVLDKMPFIKEPGFNDLLDSDNEARRYTIELMK